MKINIKDFINNQELLWVDVSNVQDIETDKTIRTLTRILSPNKICLQMFFSKNGNSTHFLLNYNPDNFARPFDENGKPLGKQISIEDIDFSGFRKIKTSPNLTPEMIVSQIDYQVISVDNIDREEIDAIHYYMEELQYLKSELIKLKDYCTKEFKFWEKTPNKFGYENTDVSNGYFDLEYRIDQILKGPNYEEEKR